MPKVYERDQPKYNETRLERVYGGMKADEREAMKKLPCTLCGYYHSARRWGTQCPHHHDEITSNALSVTSLIVAQSVTVLPRTMQS